MNTIIRGFILFIFTSAILSGCSGMLDIPDSAAIPGLTISSNTGGYSVPENPPVNGTLDIYISLARRPSADVTFSVTSSNTGSGGVGFSQSSLTFTNSNWDTPQSVRVTGVDNFIADGNRNISMWFGASTSSDPAYNGYQKPSISITVIDDETPGITVSPTSGLTTTEAAGAGHTATFSVVLSSQPTGDVTIPTITSSDTTEGTVSPGSLTFTSANWNVQQTVTITGVDDIIFDGNIDYSIQLGTSTSTDPNYNNKSFTAMTVTNIDNEVAAVIVTPTTLNLTEGTTGTFTVSLANIPTGNVTISVSSNNARATADTSLLTFTPGNYNVNQTVTVTAVNNSIHDGSATASIVLGTATGYNNEDPQDVTVNITDDDAFEIRFGSLSRHTTEGGQNATFTVKLGSQPSADVTVALDEKFSAAVNGSNQEGTINTNSLTFTTVNWNATQTVTVTGVNDDYADGNQVYLIKATASSSDTDYNGVTNNIAVTNDDDDAYGLQIVANGNTTNVTNSAVTFSGFATDDMNNLGSTYANWTIRLRSKPTADVTITLTINSSYSDGLFDANGSTSLTLTFTGANWSTPQSIGVHGASNGANEGGHEYTITSAISSSDAKYGSTTYVKNPSFAIFSSDNDAANAIAYCRKSGGFSTSENSGTAIFWLITKSAPASDESVAVTSTDTFSYLPAQAIASITTPVSGTAVITSSNYNTLESAGTNKIVAHGNDDGDEPRGGQYHYVYFAPSTPNLSFDVSDLRILNSDNDQVVMTGSANGNTSESGTTATFGVKLKIAPSSGTTVTFTVSSATPTEGTFTATELTFNDSNWNTYQNITVTGVDDHRVDGTQTINMTYSAITSTDERLDGYPSGTISTGVSNTDNDKLIWITGSAYYGNMNSGIDQADISTNTITDANFPSAMPGGTTYKALIVDGSTRIARTTSTGNTGQLNWVLQPDTEYYIKTGSFPYTTRIFTTDQYGIPGTFTVGFSNSSSDEFWTGLNSDWTTSADTCALWKQDNTMGRYGIGNTTGTGAISSGSAQSNISTKKIIAVQQ